MIFELLIGLICLVAIIAAIAICREYRPELDERGPWNDD